MAASRASSRTAGKAYKVTNWKEYNESLVRRGDVTLWLEEDVIIGWEHENAEKKVGRPFTYSEEAVRCLLSLREVFGLTYRQTEGFGRSLVRLMDAKIAIPDFTSLQKRAAKLEIPLTAKPKRGPVDIVVDSTGLKVYGDGEWKARKHGVSKRRTWRKLHIAIDPKTGEIVAEESTDNDKHDADLVEPLIEQVERPIERFYGDGAYDQRKVYEALECEAAQPIIPPRKNAKVWRHGNSSDCRLPRDQALRQIRRTSRKAWKIDVGYHSRSLVETSMHRLKAAFGDKLRSRKPPNQKAECRLRCAILNRFTQLGTPQFVWS
ncbi:Transposase DDE domain protein [Posidoniimonas polymericola]|uniref:Transposase DDE domain protein n=1 Tax=Posidoniimonas polymericola TaxID=2528002 RepID=A0A5C5XR77_9BACT|nr:IS5 family transposase [Posidoniimonas polymericola]TWT65158.1 Transposase DDE domain protein [Posidoniimonas polymericola]